MPRPSARLDLIVVSAVVEIDAASIAPGWWALGQAQGWWTGDGRSGPSAAELVEGGFVAARLHVEARPRLWANQLGGFQVRCPTGGEPVISAFTKAIGAWRDGGPRVLSACPACGALHPLEALDYRPPAAFAQLAVELIDVADGGLRPEAERLWASHGGLIRVIGRRPG
jgi:hypothetical protein